MEFLRDSIANILTTSVVVGLFVFWLKTWMTRKIDSKFREIDERNRAELEIQKAQALELLNRRGAIYPEILELVYRLRNALRDAVDVFPSDRMLWGLGEGKTRKNIDKLSALDHNLFLLKDSLYKYRALVDESVFDMLHQLKRNLQDATVIIDHLLRDNPTPPVLFTPDTWRRHLERLRELYDASDKLYRSITESIKADLEKHLPK